MINDNKSLAIGSILIVSAFSFLGLVLTANIKALNNLQNTFTITLKVDESYNQTNYTHICDTSTNSYTIWSSVPYEFF